MYCGYLTFLKVFILLFVIKNESKFTFNIQKKGIGLKLK